MFLLLVAVTLELKQHMLLRELVQRLRLLQCRVTGSG
jgi:hypothetical protein